MNIVIYSWQYWPLVGGVEFTSQILARTLVELGHNVSVFTTTRISDSTELKEGYKIYRSNNLLTFARIARTADVVVVKGGVSAFAGIGAILVRAPAIVIWHEMAGSYAHSGKSCKVRAMNLVRKHVALRSCAHVGVSCACLDSKRLTSTTVRSVHRVIYNPISSELAGAAAVLNDEYRQIDVLFVGRLIEGKGILVLADALRKLDCQGRSLLVRIVGDGDGRGQLEAALRGLKTVSVTFEGIQTGAALAHSYASARVLVVPSTHPEGMGLVVAEGMAFGLAIVASDQAVLKEVVGDAGVIVPSGDSEALASALRAILRDNEYWKELSVRARKRSELFSMTIFKLRIAELIGEVAKRS